MRKTDKETFETYFQGYQFIVVSHVIEHEWGGHFMALTEFLRTKTQRLLAVSLPFNYSRNRTPIARFYAGGRLSSEKYGNMLRSARRISLVSYTYDLIFAFYQCARLKQRRTVYVGADCLNTLIGIVLRQLGLIHLVVYYVIDYSPRRFSNGLLNLMYQWLCRFSGSHSDCIWALTGRMKRVYVAMGSCAARTLIVPTGVHPREMIPRVDTCYKRIVFIGHLVKGKGVEVVIRALPKVLAKVPNARLVVIGDGPERENLERLAGCLQVRSSVDFSGFLKEGKAAEILASCDIGVATYVHEPSCISYYADPVKPKEYMASGLPVVITPVPEVAHDIEVAGAGVVVPLEEAQIASAITDLLLIQSKLRAFQENARSMSRRFSWENIFSEAFVSSAYSCNLQK